MTLRGGDRRGHADGDRGVIVLVMADTETVAPPGRGWPDRRRDLAGWLLTPLYTIVGAPVVAGCIGLVVMTGGAQRPEFCASVRADNGCEEKVLAVLGGHAVLFGALWLSLWALPWWRGLRVPRIVLAVVAFGVLVARADLDGHLMRPVRTSSRGTG
ncbi:hypothetical protein [Micromonospora globbae]|uniref:hypothetical protein n=1 Tax=Micromonospora globbae TaxID=1894969 RepID=UPI00386894A5|nr:hypothetical protein OH732_31005 [Micromonospora globbae]